MEVEEIQAQHHNGTNTSGTNNNNNKFSRIGNGRISAGIDPADISVVSAAAIDGGGGGGNRLRGWHHSSRIIRVSRASGGKDRHSKVWTSKGLRDRRVRLSVTTAIQFYDLQDRLGYDQPSKAVEWLINAAADSISELPSLNSSAFPDTPKQLSDEKSHNQQHLSVSKSACSSTSETSKGSAGGLSLSRTTEVRVNRVKARERARERASKDKERERETPTSATADDHHHHHHQQNSNINSVATQNSSFTELLTSGITNVNSSTSPVHDHQSFFHKSGGGGGGGGSPVTVAQMDYFSSGLLNLSSTSSGRPHSQHHHVSQIHMGGSIPMSLPPPFGIGLISGGDSSAEHFSFFPEQQLIPIAAAATSQPIGAGDNSLNFSIGGAGAGGGFAGFNRGTLQSNTSQQSSIYSHHHHHQQQHFQRFSNPPMDATPAAANIPFFFGAAAVEGAAHQFPAGFDGRLQLCYGDASRVSDQKGKGKN